MCCTLYDIIEDNVWKSLKGSSTEFNTWKTQVKSIIEIDRDFLNTPSSTSV